VAPRARVEQLLAAGEGAPRCVCGEPLKPGVTMFGEMLPAEAIDRALALADRADVLLCCGSSLEVFPVAAMPGEVLNHGGAVAVLTEGPTPYDGEAALRSHAPLADVLTRLVHALGPV
jgi:NAD-dependent deacetylase